MAVLLIGFVLFCNFFLRINASYHWVVTESGKIQAQVESSGFPLTRPDDLLALLEQEQRVNTVKHLYKQLMALKRSIDSQWSKIEREGDLEKRLYSTDIDCLLGEMPLSQHNLNTEFLDYGQGSRPKMKGSYQSVEPDCTAYSELDFSMRTFPHLETLNRRNNFNLTVNSGFTKTVFDFNIDAMLRRNSSDWTAYNIASLYWRTVGNATNAVECARRALYFSPRNERFIVLLNLGTLLQELHSLGEAAIVLHSAVDHDPVQHISHLALGNVYAALGDYRRSLVCYENVLSLNPGNIRALQLKHALLCHRKLESGLLEIHSSLQKILQDLQKHNAMYEEWLLLQNQVNWERDSKVKEFLTLSQPIYLNLRMLLQTVEHQAKTLNEEVRRRVPRNNHIQFQSNKEFGRKKESKSVVCHAETCPRETEEENYEDSVEEGEENEEEEGELENLVNSEYFLKNKMNSLVTLIKTGYKEEELEKNSEKEEDVVSLLDFKEKINRQLNFLKDLNPDLPVDETLILKNIDACVKETNDVKKLN